MAVTDMVDTDLGTYFWGSGINNSGQFVTHGGFILHPAP